MPCTLTTEKREEEGSGEGMRGWAGRDERDGTR